MLLNLGNPVVKQHIKIIFQLSIPLLLRRITITCGVIVCKHHYKSIKQWRVNTYINMSSLGIPQISPQTIPSTWGLEMSLKMFKTYWYPKN